jgi:hypothetical protein
MLYPVIGLMSGDLTKTINSGRYKGWNAYVRNVYKYSIPFGYQIDQTINMDADEGIFQIFDSSNYYK